ncbi:MAG: UvrB/UvrC motif-containing protein, partial [Lactococcus chungangensis]
ETMNRKERKAAVKTLTEQMNEAAGNLDYELAAQIRDTILEIKAID